MPRFRRSLAVSTAVLVLAMAGCSSSGSKAAPSTATASTAVTSLATTSSAPSNGSAAQIIIDNFDFSPTSLTVHPGQTVTVANHDSTAHTLTSSPGKTFDTGVIDPGKSATFTAPAAPGSYPYICTIHQFMHGTLTVA